MLERSHLRIIDALERHSTLAGAADALHLTQPALSHAMKKLEERYHCKIWQRKGRNLQLTQAGSYLLDLSRRLLPQLEEAEQMLSAYGAGKRGRLRIGMECHPCYEWLLGVIRPFLQRWPDVDLDVLQRFRFDGYAALAAYNVDVLITSDPSSDHSFVHVPVLEYETRLIVHNKHPLLRRRILRPDDLHDQSIITFPVARERLDIFSQFLSPAGIEPAAQLHTEAIEIMLELVVAGRGVCTLPDWLFRKYSVDYPLKSLRLGHRGINKTLYLVLREADQKVSYLEDFCRLGAPA